MLDEEAELRRRIFVRKEALRRGYAETPEFPYSSGWRRRLERELKRDHDALANLKVTDRSVHDVVHDVRGSGGSLVRVDFVGRRRVGDR